MFTGIVLNQPPVLVDSTAEKASGTVSPNNSFLLTGNGSPKSPKLASGVSCLLGYCFQDVRTKEPLLLQERPRCVTRVLDLSTLLLVL